jgi:Uma2 family endonuclease
MQRMSRPNRGCQGQDLAVPTTYLPPPPPASYPHAFAILDAEETMQKTLEVSQYELERGKPMPSKLHGYVQLKIGTLLDMAYGEVYTLFSELNLDLSQWESVPDLSIYPKMEIDFSQDEVRVTTPPLCAIEILSPTQSLQELIDKARKYFSYGVGSCWLVIPGLKNIYVFSSPTAYRMFQDDQTLSDAVLGIELDLSKVFR